MTKRFFYTDPLAAAWMAKHFGMKLVCLHRNEDDGVDADHVGTPYPFEHAILDAEMWEDAIRGTCRNIYVHPDSLPLLEPQIGDLITGRNRKVFMFHEGATTPTENARVAERNGIPFHSPESEDA
jgi:hypothetical protein